MFFVCSLHRSDCSSFHCRVSGTQQARRIYFLRCTWEWIGCAQAMRRRVSDEYPAAWLRAHGGDSCAQAVRLRVPGEYPAVWLRVPGRILGCAVSRSCSGLFVVSIGYTLTIQRKQHEKRFTRVIKRIMKRIIITIYPIDTNAHIAYT